MKVNEETRKRTKMKSDGVCVVLRTEKLGTGSALSAVSLGFVRIPSAFQTIYTYIYINILHGSRLPTSQLESVHLGGPSGYLKCFRRDTIDKAY